MTVEGSQSAGAVQSKMILLVAVMLVDVVVGDSACIEEGS